MLATRLSFGTALLLVGTSAAAETVPLSEQIDITFTGTVVESSATTLVVRDASGNLVPYSGPLPDSPVNVGDPFTLSFTATLPTTEFLDTFNQTTDADGLLRIRTATRDYAGLPLEGVGVVSYPDTSDPFMAASYFGQSPNLVMTIAFDPATGEYFIDHDAGFTSNAYQGPGYIYDAASGSYISCSGADDCRASIGNDSVTFNLQGNPTGSTLTSGFVRVNSTDPFSGEGQGFFNWLFEGSWSLPSLSTRGSNPVPEPSMLLLFSAGAGAVFMRRRRRSVVA